MTTHPSLSSVGVQEVSRLSDKQVYYIRNQAYKMRQVCLYHSSPDSILYQEMLTFKATQTTPHTASQLQALDSDSDSEYGGGGEHYDGDAESTYFTEEEGRDNSSSSPFQILNEENKSKAEADNLLDDIEVGYCSTKRVSSPSADVPKSELIGKFSVCM